MKLCKECESELSQYEQEYLEDICINCVDSAGNCDDFDFSDIEELDFND